MVPAFAPKKYRKLNLLILFGAKIGNKIYKAIIYLKY